MTRNVADDYGWISPVGPHSCDYIVPRVLAILKTLGATRILDLGSGNGALCAQLKSAGYEAVGGEYDKKGGEIARSSHPEIHFYNYRVQGYPDDLLAKDREVDVVVSTEVIEHLFSPHLLPVYARSVLRDGGHLIVTTPYHGYLKNLALSVFNHWDVHHTALWHGGHIKFWSRATLAQ